MARHVTDTHWENFYNQFRYFSFCLSTGLFLWFLLYLYRKRMQENLRPVPHRNYAS
jgi:hypothetical protein